MLVAGASQAALIDELLRARAVVRAAHEVVGGRCSAAGLDALAEALTAYDEPGTPI